ncbi:MAG: DUF488 domain-containing protein [Terracidiphilus sp.]|nr:DUF488 domain-containing protein [Terracidiphilus sp.]MDR3797924.1 DUF488 domain-containing protein [Terracidiphilus sp.]
MEIYSIGFTKKSAGEFFGALKAAGIERLLDVRLNNTSQLAGFAKQSDLKYFLEEICGAAYEHEPLLAPTQDILDALKKQKGSWETYTEAYLALIRSRKVESAISQQSFERRTVLLCSEASAEHCHRRLALEYLQQHWNDVVIHHL